MMIGKHGLELLSMKEQLDEGIAPPDVNWEKIRDELGEAFMNLNESLALSDRVCPACGRPW